MATYLGGGTETSSVKQGVVATYLGGGTETSSVKQGVVATYLGGGTETSSVKQGVTLSRQTASLQQDLCVARIRVDIVPVIDRDLD